MSTEQPKVRPALAATILLVRDDPFEVLMVKRRRGATYSSALVFPGGVVDPSDASPDWLPHLRGAEDLSDDARALRVAACRETHEETGILLVAGWTAVHAAPAPSFLDLVRSQGLVMDLDAICPFGHWVTPDMAPKRFDTHFLLGRAPPGAEPVSDGGETVSVEWVRPSDALGRVEAGDYSILFPTLMNLKRLAESADAESAIAAARTRPVFTVQPSVSRRDGKTFICIPAEAGYGVTEYMNPT